VTQNEAPIAVFATNPYDVLQENKVKQNGPSTVVTTATPHLMTEKPKNKDNVPKTPTNMRAKAPTSMNQNTLVEKKCRQEILHTSKEETAKERVISTLVRFGNVLTLFSSQTVALRTLSDKNCETGKDCVEFIPLPNKSPPPISTSVLEKFE
jgi:hypothetical protein